MAVEQARIESGEHGSHVEGEGWFRLNLADARWRRHSVAGVYCAFEAADAEFPEYGINVHVLMPGEPNALYHEEEAQEDFLVLHGECIAVVEEQELRLKAWDLLHCPAGTRHVIVGAGDGPCAILMTGARGGQRGLHYPVSEVAARHGASAQRATDTGKEAYSHWNSELTDERLPWPLGDHG